MSLLRANFGSGSKGGSSASTPQRQLALDAARLAGSIVVFKRGKDLIVE